MLQHALARAVSETFDCLSVDGCRSTNDTVLVLASGRAGAVDPTALTDALTEVCGSLAEQMARDAEGATKLVRISVVGAPYAGRGARGRPRRRRTASSCSARSTAATPTGAGCSPSSGASGAFIDPERVDISYNGVTVCRDGIACAHDDAALARAHGRPRDRGPVRPAPGARRGDRAHDRPLARVHRREPAHVVTPYRGERRRRARPDRGREGDRPRRGAAVHPRVLGQDRRHQVRRPRDERRRAGRPVRHRRRAHAPRRHEPGRRARRRTADHRSHAPPRQGAGVRRRPPRDRRRDRRHRAHGAGREGQPRDRRVGQPARLLRSRPVRARTRA